jgi:hypothetical protein
MIGLLLMGSIMAGMPLTLGLPSRAGVLLFFYALNIFCVGACLEPLIFLGAGFGFVISGAIISAPIVL